MMMANNKLLDCGAGGCSVGYNRAGFDVVDSKEQPNYPFEFIQSDVFDLAGKQRLVPKEELEND